MSTSQKSQSAKKRRPLRTLLLLAVLAGIVVAIKNAIEDKGGSYEATDAPAPSAAPVPAPPASSVETAEQVVRQRPVENLDEFADPVKPADATAPDAPERETPAGKRASASKSANKTSTAGSVSDVDSEDAADNPGKIDPFGIR